MAFLKNGDSELLEVITVKGTIEEKFITCPHCKALVKVDTSTKMCPKCGGPLNDGSKSQAH